MLLTQSPDTANSPHMHGAHVRYDRIYALAQPMRLSTSWSRRLASRSALRRWPSTCRTPKASMQQPRRWSANMPASWAALSTMPGCARAFQSRRPLHALLPFVLPVHQLAWPCCAFSVSKSTGSSGSSCVPSQGLTHKRRCCVDSLLLLRMNMRSRGQRAACDPTVLTPSENAACAAVCCSLMAGATRLRLACITPHGHAAQVSTQDVNEEEFQRLWATNVTGLFSLTKRLAPLINEGATHHCADLGPLLIALLSADTRDSGLPGHFSTLGPARRNVTQPVIAICCCCCCCCCFENVRKTMPASAGRIGSMPALAGRSSHADMH